MSRLNREMPISDVYHEYNMSLGLAPPLSELLVTSAAAAAANQSSTSTGQTSTAANSSVASSDQDVFSSFDQISLADTVTDISEKADLAAGLKSVSYSKRPPPRPLKHHWTSSSTSSSNTYQPARHRMSVFDASSPESDVMSMASPTALTLRHGGSGMLDMTRRDEADGRSMTDSNYSGYSPHRNLKLTTLLPPPQRSQQHRTTIEEMTVIGKEHGSKGSNTIRAVAIIEASANENAV